MEELVEKAKNGNKEAFLELMNLMEKELYGIISVRLNNIEDIQDVTQETIIKAFKEIKKLKCNNYFKTWFVRIAINECNILYRKKYKQDKLYNIINNKIKYETIYDIENSVTEWLDFTNIVSSLNKDELLILTLYYSYEYNTTEIAYILNKSINTVKSKLFRVRNKLKEMYERK